MLLCYKLGYDLRNEQNVRHFEGILCKCGFYDNDRQINVLYSIFIEYIIKDPTDNRSSSIFNTVLAFGLYAVEWRPTLPVYFRIASL